MAEIHLATARGRIRLPVADLPAEATLLDAVRHAGLPLGQSCRGEGVCRSCAVDVESGGEHLGPLDPLERRYGFDDTRRLACQARLPATNAGTIVLVSHRAWGRPPPDDPAADPAAPASATGATLEP